MALLTSFHHNLISEFGPILNYLWERGFTVTMVGGAVRDYFLYGRLSHDLDFELRYKEKLGTEEWSAKLAELFSHWPFSSKIEKFPYSIFCFEYSGYDLEFSSPRREVFIKERVDHKNFEVVLLPEFTYLESFYRRDFTINAIGVELTSMGPMLVDPYKGMIDLKEKKLKPVSRDFAQDPVRFLRAIRFSLKHGLTISDELKVEMKKMNLSAITTHYIKSEMIKSGNLALFWESLKSYCETFHNQVSPELKALFVMQAGPFNASNLEEWVISCHLHKPLLATDLKKIVNYFSLSENKLKSLLSYYDHVKVLTKTEVILLQKKNLKEALLDPNLKLISELAALIGRLKGRNLEFGLKESEKDCLTLLKLDHLVGIEEARLALKTHNIPESYMPCVKFFYHLKQLSL